MRTNTRIDTAKDEDLKRLATLEGRTISEVVVNDKESITIHFTDGYSLHVANGNYSSLILALPTQVKRYHVTSTVLGVSTLHVFDDPDLADEYRSHFLDKGIEVSEVVSVSTQY